MPWTEQPEQTEGRLSGAFNKIKQILANPLPKEFPLEKITSAHAMLSWHFRILSKEAGEELENLLTGDNFQEFLQQLSKINPNYRLNDQLSDTGFSLEEVKRYMLVFELLDRLRIIKRRLLSRKHPATKLQALPKVETDPGRQQFLPDLLAEDLQISESDIEQIMSTPYAEIVANKVKRRRFHKLIQIMVVLIWFSVPLSLAAGAGVLGVLKYIKDNNLGRFLVQSNVESEIIDSSEVVINGDDLVLMTGLAMPGGIIPLSEVSEEVTDEGFSARKVRESIAELLEEQNNGEGEGYESAEEEVAEGAYDYLKENFLRIIPILREQYEGVEGGEIYLESLGRIEQKLLNDEPIVINILINDKTGADAPDRAYYPRNPQIGNVDGPIQLVISPDGVEVLIVPRNLDVPVFGDPNDSTRITETVEMHYLGTALSLDPDQSGVIPIRADDGGSFRTMSAITGGREADLGFRLTLGELESIFGTFFPEGIELTFSGGYTGYRIIDADNVYEDPSLKAEPGVPRRYTSEQFLFMLRNRRFTLGDQDINSSNQRGIVFIAALITGDNNLDSILNTADYSAGFAAIFAARDLSVTNSTFIVEGDGGSSVDHVVWYQLFNIFAASSDSFGEDFKNQISASLGIHSLATISQAEIDTNVQGYLQENR